MKRFSIIFVVSALCLSLCACGGPEVQTEYNASSTSMFVEVEHQSDNWRVVYHKETRVMYAVSLGAYNRGTFTMLVNADGSPMLWNGY